MINTCEFILHGYLDGPQGTLHLIGRCGDLPIRLGEVFDQLQHPADEPRPVRVKVERIESYQRELQELGPGMTAKLDVRGEGLDWLRPRSVLVVSSSLPHADLAAIGTSQDTSNG